MPFYFFYSETKNGPINITFLVNYVIIFITLILLVLIVLLLTSYTSKFFPYKPVREDLQRQKPKEQKLLMKIKVRVNKVRKILQIILYTTLFLLNWQIFERALGLGGIFFASLNITAIYFIGKFILYYRKLKKQEIKFNLKQVILLIKSQFQAKYLFYAILCNAYFIGIYLIFSFFYPFAFMWPSNFLNTGLAAVVVFPVYFSLELLFRKVIYPITR